MPARRPGDSFCSIHLGFVAKKDAYSFKHPEQQTGERRANMEKLLRVEKLRQKRDPGKVQAIKSHNFVCGECLDNTDKIVAEARELGGYREAPSGGCQKSALEGETVAFARLREQGFVKVRLFSPQEAEEKLEQLYEVYGEDGWKNIFNEQYTQKATSGVTGRQKKALEKPGPRRPRKKPKTAASSEQTAPADVLKELLDRIMKELRESFPKYQKMKPLKPTLLRTRSRSARGQHRHTDWLFEEVQKAQLYGAPLSALLPFYNGYTLRVWPKSHMRDSAFDCKCTCEQGVICKGNYENEGEIITLEAGEVLFFVGDLLHAGTGGFKGCDGRYKVRLHVYIAPEGYEGNPEEFSNGC